MDVKEPEFPKEFVKDHCPKVLEARHWREVYKAEGTDEDDMQFAECAFKTAGCGMQCESCDEFLAGVHMNEVEEKFLPLIRQYYKDVKVYERQQRKLENERRRLEAMHRRDLMDVGSGI